MFILNINLFIMSFVLDSFAIEALATATRFGMAQQVLRVITNHVTAKPAPTTQLPLPSKVTISNNSNKKRV